MSGWIEIIGRQITKTLPYSKIFPNEGGVFLRFGKYRRTLEPGLYWKIPLIDDIKKLDITPQVINLPNQSITTKDKVTLAVSGAIEYSIRDAKRALLEVQDFDKSLQNLSMGIIANYAHEKTYEECLNIKELEDVVIRGIRERANSWGLNIRKFWVTDLAEHKVYRLMTHETPYFVYPVVEAE